MLTITRISLILAKEANGSSKRQLLFVALVALSYLYLIISCLMSMFILVPVQGVHTQVF